MKSHTPNEDIPHAEPPRPQRKFVVKLLAFFLLVALPEIALADGGVTLGQINRNGLLVTVFAAPSPIRAGPLDVTFLVQEVPSNQPVTDAEIVCSVEKTSPPSRNPVRLPAWCSTISPGTRVPATNTHSRNKLLSGAYLPLTEPGRWQLNVSVTRGPATFAADFPFEVAAPQQPFSTWWPLIALVPAAIFLYGWRARLVRCNLKPTGGTTAVSSVDSNGPDSAGPSKGVGGLHRGS
jgi:hypothetical protein